MNNRLLVILTALILSGSKAAFASPINKTLEVVASDFFLFLGDALPLPVDPLIMDFSISFDNASDISQTTQGLTINSFNLPPVATYAYYASGDLFILATDAHTSGCSGGSPGSFCMFLTNFSTNPVASLVQQSAAAGSLWRASTVTVTPAAIPSPATIALFSLGLVGLGWSKGRKTQI